MGSPRRIFIVIFTVLLSAPLLAAEPAEVKEQKKWSFYLPYVPERRDYGIQLGGMWENNNLYWIGGHAGFHVGRCMFSGSQTCQQYFDIIGGAGGRDGLTEGLLLGSLRWQFVNLPSPVSPTVRVFSGVMNIRDDRRDKSILVYGLGYGYRVAVHERLDLSFEARVGGGDKIWGQALFSLNLKVDKWVEFFAKKIESIGVGTVRAGGTIIKKTITAPVKVLDWVGPKKENIPDSKSKTPNL